MFSFGWVYLAKYGEKPRIYRVRTRFPINGVCFCESDDGGLDVVCSDGAVVHIGVKDRESKRKGLMEKSIWWCIGFGVLVCVFLLSLYAVSYGCSEDQNNKVTELIERVIESDMSDSNKLVLYDRLLSMWEECLDTWEHKDKKVRK